MAITQKQREDRRKWLGSSDMAAVLGLDPFRNAYDCWAEKTGRVDGFEGNDATERGSLLEGAVLDWAEKEIGAPLFRNIFCPSATVLAANLDADCAERNAIVEAKTSSQPDEWGDPGTDQVPLRTIVQTHVAMFCSGRRKAFVPVLLPLFGRFDFRIYEIKYRDDVAQAIVVKAEAFWRDHVLADLPPEGVAGSIDVLKRIKREPDTWATIPGELLDRWIAAKAAAAEADKAKKEAEAELLTAMGTCDGARTDTGQTVTYLEQTRKEYVCAASTFRVLRLVGAKRAKKLEPAIAGKE